MLLVRLALRNPYIVLVLGMAIVVLGATVLERIPTDILPQFKTPAVQIVTFYPGMPAETVERDRICCSGAGSLWKGGGS